MGEMERGDYDLNTKAGVTGPYCSHQTLAPFVSWGFSIILVAKPLSCAAQVACALND